MLSETHADPGFLPPSPDRSADVRSFIARLGTVYDAPADTYQREALELHGRHGKTSPLYNAHAYHTKVPPAAIRAYIEHYSDSGDLVLDPFCGSGMTGAAALLAGRNAVLSDLSPAAVHIAYNYCAPVDLVALARAWRAITAELADEFAYLYGTACDRCGGQATIQFTVWSDVLACPRCSGEIVLWDAAVVREQATRPGGVHAWEPPVSGLTQASAWAPPSAGTVATNKKGERRAAGDVLERFACPGCLADLDKGDCSYLHTAPVLTSYDCHSVCRPRRSAHATTATERARIAEIATEQSPCWTPEVPFSPTREMWRGQHRDQGIQLVRDFWTPRNLRALADLWARAAAEPDHRLRRALRFVLTSCFNRSSKTTRYLFGKGGNSSMNGTLYVGAFTCENNLLALLSRKFEDIIAGLSEQQQYRGEACVSLASATQLAGVPDASIDYVFTDPPFGSNIFYADCSLLWEAWLGELTDDSQEAVWNKSRATADGGKTLPEYGRLMEEAFAELHRVLKPGRWATIVFSNSDGRVWQSIQTAAERAGFAVAGAGTLDKLQRSFKGVRGDKGEESVVTKDVILNLLKPVEGGALRLAGSIPDPEEHVVRLLSAYLAGLSLREEQGEPLRLERATQALYDQVITVLLKEGLPTTGIGLAFVQSVAQRAFKQVDGCWYRRGDRISSQEMLLEIKDEASAILWLDARLRAAPETESALLPDFYLASATARLPLDLQRLLSENFVVNSRTNSWRAPTVPERDALNDGAALHRRRQIVRLAAGSEDRTSRELLDLAEEAVRLELYPEAQRLVERLHAPELSASEAERYALIRAVAAAFDAG